MDMITIDKSGKREWSALDILDRVKPEDPCEKVRRLEKEIAELRTSSCVQLAGFVRSGGSWNRWKKRRFRDLFRSARPGASRATFGSGRNFCGLVTENCYFPDCGPPGMSRPFVVCL
jgi:hypothetical protein